MNTSFKTLLIAAAVASLAGCGNHGQQASNNAPVMAADGSYKAPNGDTMEGGMNMTRMQSQLAAIKANDQRQHDKEQAEFDKRNANRKAHGLAANPLPPDLAIWRFGKASTVNNKGII